MLIRPMCSAAGRFEGRVLTPDVSDFWAPSVIELDGLKFYMYCSFEFYGDTPDEAATDEQCSSHAPILPLGPFEMQGEAPAPVLDILMLSKTKASVYILLHQQV